MVSRRDLEVNLCRAVHTFKRGLTMRAPWVLPLVLTSCFSASLEPLSLTSQYVQTLQMNASTSPRVVWVLDNSGSMHFPVLPKDESCGDCGPSLLCPSTCLTRKEWLVDWLATQSLGLTQHASIVYPSNAVCAGPQSLAWFDSVEPLAQDWGSKSPAGGTPTGHALAFAAANVPAVTTTDTFVVLLTDSLPNCNEENPNNSCSGVENNCRCTTNSCTGGLCSLGCLDEDGVVASSNALAAIGHRLLVAGLTSDTSDSVTSKPEILGSMTISLPATCTSDADCRAGTSCNQGACADRFFSISGDADLSRVTARLTTAIAQTKACLFTSPTSMNDPSLSVTLDGVVLTTSDYVIEDRAQRLRLTGEACAKLVAQPALSLTVTQKVRSVPTL